jgi:UTP--glucose-1-phosphate uridylyltransferase
MVPSKRTAKNVCVLARLIMASVSWISPPGTALSNLHITGRYILQPEIFEILERRELGAGGEIQLTDAMINLARTQPFFAVRFDGTIYDCGGRIGFLAANIAYAMDREELAAPLRAELTKLLSR